MITTIITLTGLTCPACKTLCEKRIAKIPGVKTVTVDLSSGKTVIEADREIPLAEIKTALEGTPYEAKN